MCGLFVLYNLFFFPFPNHPPPVTRAPREWEETVAKGKNVDLLGYYCLRTSHVRVQEKSQMSNHLWIPCVLCLVSHGLSLCGQVFALESYYWNRSPGEGVYSVLNRGSRHTGHGARWLHSNQCVTRLWNAPQTGCWEGNPGLCFHLVSGSLMFTWCPSCTLTFTCPSLACAALPCQLPSPGDLIVSAHSCSLSPCLDVLLCVTQWVSLFLVCFFF